MRAIWITWIRRCYWLLVTGACFILSGWQVWIGMDRYLQASISTAVTVESLKHFKFPIVTICKNYHLFYSCIRSEIGSKKLINGTISVDEWNAIWNECGMKKKQVFSSVPCNIAINNTACKESMRNENYTIFELFQSPFGQCVSLKTTQSYINDPDRTSRAKWRIKIVDDDHIKRRHANADFVSYNLVTQDSLSTGMNFFYYAERVYSKRTTEIYFTKKEYHYLNTADKPCQSEFKRRQIRINCLVKLLDQQITCKLLFMQFSRLKLCQTIAEINLTMQKVKTFVLEADFDKCDYHRACKYIQYVISRSSWIPTNEKLQIDLRIQEKTNEIFTEYYSYQLSDLVNDLAANLGFFLGISLFSIMDIIEIIAIKIYTVVN